MNDVEVAVKLSSLCMSTLDIIFLVVILYLLAKIGDLKRTMKELAKIIDTNYRSLYNVATMVDQIEERVNNLEENESDNENEWD